MTFHKLAPEISSCTSFAGMLWEIIKLYRFCDGVEGTPGEEERREPGEEEDPLLTNYRQKVRNHRSVIPSFFFLLLLVKKVLSR